MTKLTHLQLFESTAPSIAGWNSHITGLGQLVLLRGPDKHRSPFARAILEVFRNSAVCLWLSHQPFHLYSEIRVQMIQRMRCRKSSFLNTPEWQNMPWAGSPKDVYQKLYDKGEALVALLLEIDSLKTIGESTSIAVLSKYLLRLSEMDAMEAWFLEISNESPALLYWSTQSNTTSSNATGWHLSEALGQSPRAPFAFHTLRLACITVTFWALKLMLSNTIALACDSILSTNTEGRASASQGFDVIGTAQHLLNKYVTPYSLELATKIMRSMLYCLNDSMGLWGAQKTLFALRTALFSLRRHPGEELKWCQAVYQEMDNRKGLRYVREIANLDGRWSVSGRDSLLTTVNNKRGGEVPGSGVP